MGDNSHNPVLFCSPSLFAKLLLNQVPSEKWSTHMEGVLSFLDWTPFHPYEKENIFWQLPPLQVVLFSLYS